MIQLGAFSKQKFLIKLLRARCSVRAIATLFPARSSKTLNPTARNFLINLFQEQSLWTIWLKIIRMRRCQGLRQPLATKDFYQSLLAYGNLISAAISCSLKITIMSLLRPEDSSHAASTCLRQFVIKVINGFRPHVVRCRVAEFVA